MENIYIVNLIGRHKCVYEDLQDGEVYLAKGDCSPLNRSSAIACRSVYSFHSSLITLRVQTASLFGRRTHYVC